ncbi:hypothetical protein [Aliiroseovarius sp.]|nr:hypothetical protein [Aliiroseovarius sp.]
MMLGIAKGILLVFSAAMIGKVLMKRYPDSGFNIFNKKADEG